MSFSEDLPIGDDSEATFRRAKLPMIVAAAGIAGGIAIAASAERTVGGAILLGAWGLGIVALHRLGRAGSRSGPGDR